MRIFFGNCTHLLTRIQQKKFVFLFKIANKGTTLEYQQNRNRKIPNILDAMAIRKVHRQE